MSTIQYGLAAAIRDVKTACAQAGVDDYDGEAVSFLTALLMLADNPTMRADEAVLSAYSLDESTRYIGVGPLPQWETAMYATDAALEAWERDGHVHAPHNALPMWHAAIACPKGA